MTSPLERSIVSARELPVDAILEPIEADSARQLVDAVRNAVVAGRFVVVAPDGLAEDNEHWVALTSVLVIEGVAAIETNRPGSARRILDVMTAIRNADEAVIEA